MKYLLLFFLFFPSALPAQRISVDSLENNGYRVRIYKPEQKPKERIVMIRQRDTIYIPVMHIILIHDTLIRERTSFYRYERTEKMPKENGAQLSELQALQTLLIGNANTNGYGMHLGVMLSMGKRLSFFIGAGMGYNSVTKLTHLDLAGQLMIGIW
jgi:hypothetical protein